MFDDEADTISLDEELEPLMITGDLDAVEPTQPVDRDTVQDSGPFTTVEDDVMLNKRAATNAVWPPTPKTPADRAVPYRRRAALDRAITAL